MATDSVFKSYKQRYDDRQTEEYTLEEWLHKCADDSSYYANAFERLLTAIGDPVIFDTSKDERMGRIFLNRTIQTYPDSFGNFYGMEDTISNIVSFLTHAAQGLEEARQILYLLGPVGGGKSSIAERLKQLMQRVPIWALKSFNHAANEGRGEWQISPCYESPLGLFDPDQDGQDLKDRFGIPLRYLDGIVSPWATKRIDEVNGDLSQFRVVGLYPSILKQIAVTKVEPGDENNQDISSLVGKVNIRELEEHNEHDPDAYNWAGGLNVSTQGIMEFVEMFKAPIKMLHPLLTATQESHYNGTAQFGAIPHHGIILAHSNESEWQTFRNNKNNEAFLDRVSIVKVPYVLRVQEERAIYEKLIQNSALAKAKCAPGTLDIMAQYSVLTRLKDPENSAIFSKMEIYDGKNLKSKDPKAKSLDEYRTDAGVNEGMTGSSTRFAFKVLSKVFNFDRNEIAANPIHLMFVLQKEIEEESLPPEDEENRIKFIKGTLAPKYAEFLGDELQKCYLESYHEYGQNIFDRYISLADFWIQDKDYRDPDTGQLFDREQLDQELEKVEKAAGVAGKKDFRNEVVNFVIRHQANHGGNNPDWTSYEKLREVIEKKMFSNTEEILPVISFSEKKTEDDQKKHNKFVERMVDKGYTERQVRLAVEWYLRWKKSA